MKRLGLLIYILLGIILGIKANPFYAVRQLGMEQGLSNNNVVDIVQDKRGRLWFATEEGLNRFDGSGFISYYKEEKGGLTGNELNCLLDDPADSLLWIGTQRAGLNVYDYANDRFTYYRHIAGDSNSLITNDITDIAPAADGNLWVSTYWNGVEYFDKKAKQFIHYNRDNVSGLVSNQVWSVLDGKDGCLYIGHVFDGFTVLSVKDRTARNYKADSENPNALPGNEVKCVYKDLNGNIWVGTNRGVALFNPQSGKFIPFRDREGRLNRYVFDICQFADNKLWIAMELGGIAILDLSQRMFVAPDDFKFEFVDDGNEFYGLSNSSIRCLYQDSFNNVWAGVWGGNIRFFSSVPSLFGIYNYSPFQASDVVLSDPVVMSVCCDKEEKIWVGTNEGLNVFHKGKRIATLTNTTGSYRANIVQSSLCDSKGRLWFGLFRGGVNLYDERTHVFRQLFPKSKAGTDVREIYEDNDHVIWLSTSKGIYKVDGETLSIVKHYELGHSLVRSIRKDRNGNLWVGTFGGGLEVYDQSMKRIRLFDVESGFPSNTVNQVYEDRKHRMWIATGEGLVCFEPGALEDYRVYHRKHGLANVHIHAIVDDGKNNIWVSTNHGIYCLPEKADTFLSYDESYHVPLGSFNNGCVTVDKSGTIYFGSTDGLCYFNPEYVLARRESPMPVISQIKIFEPLEDQQLGERNIFPKQDETVRLKYDQNTLAVSFNVLNYALADQVEYAYMLKGLESSWYTVDEPDNVVFRSLPPGNYELFVKTRIRNQEWSEQIVSLPISIAFPLWLTWWAKTIYVLIALGLVVGALMFYRRRLNLIYLYESEKRNRIQERELTQERLRFYTNITHELRTPLTLILGPLEDLLKSHSLVPKDKQKISVIHQSAVRLLNLINQLLEFRKAETQNRQLCVSQGNLAAVVHEIGLKYKELNRKPSVDILIETESDNMQLFFDKEVITIVLDNLISNALKYTEQGKITLMLQWKERNASKYAEISVSDTGYGIDAEALPHIFDRYYQERSEHQASGTGIGLALVKNLVNLHEAQIEVESKLNEGSIFTILLQADYVYPQALHGESMENETHGAAAEAEDVKEESQNNKPIVLVVEDNADISEYIAESLSEEFDVRIAENGKVGLQSAVKWVPDIIVSDVMMPVMDGIEMCRKIKDNICTCHIPVILLTAKDSLSDKEAGYQYGADSYMTKPFSASLLRTRIHNLLAMRRRLVERLSGASSMEIKKTVIAENCSKLDNEFLAKLTQLIEENLSQEKVDVKYLSDKLCMSSSTLYRKMKALTGLSTNEYVRKVKMRSAEKLLLEGKYTISEIAFMVGMNGTGYFRQCFKDEFGVSPSDYVKQLKAPSSDKLC